MNVLRWLSVLQYNVNWFKNTVMVTCLRDLHIQEFDIIAIQELWKNFYQDTTHHSVKDKFVLIYSDSQEIQRSV